MRLCQTMRTEAGRVWRQMDDARDLGMSMGEETITETALYQVARHHQSGAIEVSLATKPQEYKHGADWEWWFTAKGSSFGFRVQAKRLFPSGRYESVSSAKGKLHVALRRLQGPEGSRRRLPRAADRSRLQPEDLPFRSGRRRDPARPGVDRQHLGHVVFEAIKPQDRQRLPRPGQQEG